MLCLAHSVIVKSLLVLLIGLSNLLDSWASVLFRFLSNVSFQTVLMLFSFTVLLGHRA